MIGLILALITGILLGLTGGGGSILTVPILVYVVGLTPVLATSYSLFIVGVTSLFGAIVYYKKKQLDAKLALYFALPSMLTVWLVRYFVIHKIPLNILDINGWVLSRDTFLMLFFALIMILSGVKMLFLKAEEENIKEKNYLIIAVIGIIVGSLSGLIGAGGGFLIVPALTIFMGMPIKKAIGTSLLVIAINSLIGFTGDIAYLKDIDWRYLIEFSVLATLGIFIAIFISKFLNAKKLKMFFGWFVFIMAIVLITKELKYK